MLPGRNKLAAVVIGIAVAGAPVLSLQYLVEHHIERQGRAEVEITARRGIALAESRIRRVIAGLIDLGNRGIDGCSLVEHEALSATAFDIMPIKELAVVDPSGKTLCTNHGLSLGERHIVSLNVARSAANMFVEVLTIGERRERMVRIRHMHREGGNGLAALIPAELMLAQVSSDGGSLRPHALMAARDGTLIGETGVKPGADETDGDRVIATLKSKDYGMTITSSMSRTSLAASRSDVRLVGSLVGAAIFTLIIAFFVLVRWRQRDNPVAEIRRALQADEFVPYYQPILDISNGRLEGAEVLIRWRKPDGSIISPAGFIPLLESSGLIFEVTRALMQRVCREAGPAIGRRPRCKISFNLTARHFTDHSLVKEIRDIFTDSPIALSQLALEVTERQPLENLTAVRSVIADLQGLGVRVAIDDVGAGHGGLSYLLKLGVDIIKIDKLFVDAIGAERHSAVIINSLVELARSMRMDIVAEGVESFEQVVYLRDQGIRLAQGYVFAPPLPGLSFLQLLEATDPTGREDGMQPSAPRYISAQNQVAVA
ncbi:MAG TPA: EAL domain-containing protein [Xanthobacteraceae bacterium]|nr:EAL domain-containing protein [Xanthobacteraceae bacterium]